MKSKLRAITEQGLARLGAANCRVVDVVCSQEIEPPLAVILVACEGKKPLPILVEDEDQEDLAPFILKKLQHYLTASE